MATDPATVCCLTGVDVDTEAAVEKAFGKFRDKALMENREYVFSALGVNVYSIKEEYKVSVVAELWFERIPREN